MHVVELWRDLVKSTPGVSLEPAEIKEGGIAGDRLVQVVCTSGPRAGRVVTARTHPRLLEHAGTLDGEGRPLIDGYPWESAEGTVPCARRLRATRSTPSSTTAMGRSASTCSRAGGL
jgi:MOSC N-terminal beta barrel domain